MSTNTSFVPDLLSIIQKFVDADPGNPEYKTMREEAKKALNQLAEMFGKVVRGTFAKGPCDQGDDE